MELTNCKIYKLTGTTKEGQQLIYVGSTRQKIYQRLAEHRYENKMKRTNTSSSKVLDCKDYKLEIIESYILISKKDLLTREKYFINFFKCVNKHNNRENLTAYPAKIL